MYAGSGRPKNIVCRGRVFGAAGRAAKNGERGNAGCACGQFLKKFWKKICKIIDYLDFSCYDICLIKLLEVSASLSQQPGYVVVSSERLFSADL